MHFEFFVRSKDCDPEHDGSADNCGGDMRSPFAVRFRGVHSMWQEVSNDDGKESARRKSAQDSEQRFERRERERKCDTDEDSRRNREVERKRFSIGISGFLEDKEFRYLLYQLMEKNAECSGGAYPPIYEESRNDEKAVGHIVNRIAYENPPSVYSGVGVACGSFVVMVHVREQTVNYFKQYDTARDGSSSKSDRPAFMKSLSDEMIRKNGKNARRERCEVRNASLHPRAKRLMGEYDADERCEHDAYGGRDRAEYKRHMF